MSPIRNLLFGDFLGLQYKVDLVALAFLPEASPEVEEDVGHKCDVREGIDNHPRDPGVVVGEESNVQWEHDHVDQ